MASLGTRLCTVYSRDISRAKIKRGSMHSGNTYCGDSRVGSRGGRSCGLSLYQQMITRMCTSTSQAIGRPTVFYAVFEHQLRTLLARFPPRCDLQNSTISITLWGSNWTFRIASHIPKVYLETQSLVREDDGHRSHVHCLLVASHRIW